MVEREESGSKGRFVATEDGRTLGHLTFTRAGDTLVILDHTEVSDEARGTGLGRQLVDAAVAWAREARLSIIPLCPYARSVFEKDASLQDVWRR
jgi:predicted GNAT family acetyltransferase